MRTLALLLSLTLAHALSAGNYQEAMRQNISQLYKVNQVEEINAIAANFKRIAAAENDQWLPQYYAAYAYTRSCHFISDADAIDQQLDKAQAELDVLFKSHKTESELHVLQAFIYSLRITNPSRGYKYSSLSNTSLSKAEQLNPKNPRIYYCKGSNVFHTPKMFGGGKAKAKPLFEKASKLFHSENDSTSLKPHWGKAHNRAMLYKCLDSE